MKELNEKNADKVETIAETPIEKKKVFLGTVHPKKGHTMFEVNLIEKTIEFAKFDKNVIITFADAQQVKKQNKTITKIPNCIYVSALNKKNVIKILKRDAGIDLIMKE